MVLSVICLMDDECKRRETGISGLKEEISRVLVMCPDLQRRNPPCRPEGAEVRRGEKPAEIHDVGLDCHNQYLPPIAEYTI